MKRQWLAFRRTSSQAAPSAPADSEISRHSLQSLIFFAMRHRDEVDRARVVPALLSIYRSERQEGYRILALAALHALGDAAAMQALGQHVRSEPSDRVRQLTLAVLDDYFRTQVC